MVEPIMYFGIGFLVAALLGLLFVPLVHNRAVRLTMRRLEAATPLSIAEIRADKDQLRAEFAMSTRRLEMSVEQMKTKTTVAARRTRQEDRRHHPAQERTRRKDRGDFRARSARQNLRDQLRATEEEFELKSGALRDAERALADKEAELAKLLGRTRRALDHGRQPARRTRGVAHSGRSDEGQRRRLRARGAGDRRAPGARTREAEAAATQSNEARGKLGELATRTGELERQLTAQTTEAEVLSRRVQELEARLGDQGRHARRTRLSSRPAARDLEAANKIENDLRERARQCRRPQQRCRQQIPRRHRPARSANWPRQSSSAPSCKTRSLRMRRDTESTGPAERVENALLRERINDVAAEVARLTATLEGPSSPIESMLALAPLERRPQPKERTAPPGSNGTNAEPARLHRPRAAGQRHTGRPHPRPAIDRLARRIVERREVARRREASLDTRPKPFLKSAADPDRALSSAGERSLHTGEVVGSIPTAPTI